MNITLLTFYIPTWGAVVTWRPCSANWGDGSSISLDTISKLRQFYIPFHLVSMPSKGSHKSSSCMCVCMCECTRMLCMCLQVQKLCQETNFLFM